jgi:exopolysaccharide production protein ExoQ
LTAYAELSPRWFLLPIAASAIVLGLLAGHEPALAFGAAFALLFVAIALIDLTAGTCLFAILTLFDALVPSGGFPIAKLAGLLLVVSWLAAVTVGERRRERLLESNTLLYLLLLFVAWAVLSAVWAEDPGRVFTAVSRYVPNAMLLLIVYAAARTRKQAMWIAAALLIASVLSAAYGIAYPVEADVEGRLSGSLGNANETAAALGVGVALAGGLAFAMRGRPWLRLAAGLGVPICSVALFMTASRGGLVALAAMLVAGVLFAGPRRKVVLTVALLATLGGFLYFGAFADPQQREHLLQSNGGTGRSDIWKVGWRMVEANPVLGVGAGNFSSSSVRYLLEPGAITHSNYIVDVPKVAHNTYLEVLAELGAVGLILFLAVLGSLVAAVVRAVRQFAAAGDEEMEMLSRAVLIAIIGFLTAAFFGSREFSNQLWLLLSLAPVLLRIARVELGAGVTLPTAEAETGATPADVPSPDAARWA